VYATHRDLGEHDWGEITVWEPGRRLVHTFTLAQDPEHPSEVAVEFAPRADGSTLRFAHGGWTDANANERARFGDWPVLLRAVRRARRLGHVGEQLLQDPTGKTKAGPRVLRQAAPRDPTFAYPCAVRRL
jgi:hypothetical protein